MQFKYLLLFYINFFLPFADVVRTTHQVRGGGGRDGGQDLYAHLLHHRQLPRRICSHCVSDIAYITFNYIGSA
jgi:hypothetical protein